MSASTIARRYSSALVDLCEEQNNQDDVRADFARLAELLELSPEVKDFLANPVVPDAERRALLENMLSGLKIEGLVANLTRVLLDKNRFMAVDAIYKRFNEQTDDRTGRVKARLTSASPLSEEVKTRVHAMLTRQFEKEVVLETAIDPSLIGGLLIHVGHRVYDGSVRNHLEKMHDKLMSGYAH